MAKDVAVFNKAQDYETRMRVETSERIREVVCEGHQTEDLTRPRDVNNGTRETEEVLKAYTP
jgi:hypothetical protein